MVGIDIMFCVKKQQNIRKRSDENRQKRRFPAYFRYFQPEKTCFFECRASSHFRYCHFASVCKISWRNIKYSSKTQELPFSGINRLFRRFLESSGFKYQFYWQLNHAWWWALLSIMFLYEKTTKYEKKYEKKVQWKSMISGIFPEKNFSQKSDSAMFFEYS